MSYNINEDKTDNHYNCPVVAYYSEVIKNNVKGLKEEGITYINDYVNISEKKHFAQKMFEHLQKYFKDITLSEVKEASKKAYAEFKKYEDSIFEEGKNIINKARFNNKTIIILAGRPYHVDPLINHDIDKLILSYNCAVISEDVISKMVKKVDPATVLNQWTYHSRLYKTANYIASYNDMQLLQLVSFGCGVDAVTTDEVRDILERHGKIYTQVKIDEVTNLGTVKIRIRSLLEALKKRKER
jgi:predicted nucleotide-binding protein (sugar kinase/HSP70/actin superfamily)